MATFFAGPRSRGFCSISGAAVARTGGVATSAVAATISVSAGLLAGSRTAGAAAGAAVSVGVGLDMMCLDVLFCDASRYSFMVN